MSGPPPTPTEILKAKGSWRGKLNKNEPKPIKAKNPNPPTHLPKLAKKVWKKFVQHLQEMKILSNADLGSVERYCFMYEQLRDAQKIIKGGQFFDDQFGHPRKHPAVQVARDLSKDLLAIEIQFGLTPSARARITVDEDDDSDDEFTYIEQGPSE